MSRQQSATFQEALETVESLPEDQQEDLIHSRRIERRREILAARIKEARAEYARGEVTQGTVDDLMTELTE